MKYVSTPPLQNMSKIRLGLESNHRDYSFVIAQVKKVETPSACVGSLLKLNGKRCYLLHTLPLTVPPFSPNFMPMSITVSE